MIDIQYLVIPLNKDLINFENNKAGWFSEEDLEKLNVGDIKTKIKDLFKMVDDYYRVTNEYIDS